MALPTPSPGLVIRYAYLWRSDVERGRTEGVKDRPCAVVLATVREADGRLTVVVAPITHAPPVDPARAIELPIATKARLGLDDARSWIVTDDLNVFVWPGPDLRPIDPRRPERGVAYGHLPRKLTIALIEAVRRQARAGRARPVGRDGP